MSRSKQREAIILAIDCGKSMSEKSLGSDKSVFELSKQCLEKIIRQKIFAETKSEYLLVEFSTNTAAFGVKINGQLRSPNLELLRYISSRLEVSETSQTTNVMDALSETISQEMVQNLKVQNFCAVKVALFTNFKGLDLKDMIRFRTDIIPRLKQHCIQLTIICDFVPNSSSSCHLSHSEKLAVQLMELTEQSSVGFFYDLKTALKTFSEFEAKKTCPVAWYSSLQLGTGLNALNIPIAAYNKALPYRRKTGISVSTDTSSSQVTPIRRVKTFESKTDENVTQVEKEKVIRGYSYGQTVIPLSDEDRAAFKYDKSEKGLKILGFTSIQNIGVSQRIGLKTSYVLPDPRPKQDNHKSVFQAVVTAMFMQQKVAIVRYVYQDRSAPQIGYLFPFVEDNNLLLSYIQLPFAEDICNHRFPSLESSSNRRTDKQLEVIDSLIDSMDLMTAGTDEDNNPCEALISHEMADPLLQHWFYCLYYKSLDQFNSELPQISEDLKSQIEPPIKLLQKAVKPLLQILENFPLGHNKDKTSKKSTSRLSSASQSENKRARIDYGLNESLEMVDIKSNIIDLIDSNTSFKVIADKFNQYFKALFDNFGKFEAEVEAIVDLIELFRKKSIEFEDPNPFNDFMFQTMVSFRDTNLWYSMLSKEIKPIGQRECPKSSLVEESIDNFISLSEDIKPFERKVSQI